MRRCVGALQQDDARACVHVICAYVQSRCTCTCVFTRTCVFIHIFVSCVFIHMCTEHDWKDSEDCPLPSMTRTYVRLCSAPRVCACVCVLSCHKAAVTYELPDTLMGSDMSVVPIG